jgi:predicted exporter
LILEDTMNMNPESSRRLAALVLIGAVLAGCASVPEGLSPELLQKIESRGTRADHETLAVYYENRGAAARDIAARHRKMAATYQARLANSPVGADAAAHCLAIARRQESIASEYEGLAEGHQAVANETQP